MKHTNSKIHRPRIIVPACSKPRVNHEFKLAMIAGDRYGSVTVHECRWCHVERHKTRYGVVYVEDD